MPNLDSITVFGVCPRCSRSGLDEDGNRLTGYKLVEYNGEYMCELCKIELIDRQHDQEANERHVETEEFFHSIGMRNTTE